jgi:hypothetical protein
MSNKNGQEGSHSKGGNQGGGVCELPCAVRLEIVNTGSALTTRFFLSSSSKVWAPGSLGRSALNHLRRNDDVTLGQAGGKGAMKVRVQSVAPLHAAVLAGATRPR